MSLPLSSLAARVTSVGVVAPVYADILATLQDTARSIFGSDIDIAPDTQDGQLIAIFAKAVTDANAAVIAAYHSLNPATAVGDALSSNVKLNGIERQAASQSTADVVIVGDYGTSIIKGVVSDINGVQWDLDSPITIPISSTITVTATCEDEGAVIALAHTINQIVTPVFGWASVDNPAAAAVGVPVESDGELRLRQADSVANPAMTVIQAILGAVKAVAGVQQAQIYENDTGSTDTLGLPANSIAVVAVGGDDNDIATAIMNKKNPGPYLQGTTVISLVDAVGTTQTIRFTRPTAIDINVYLTIKTYTGYTIQVLNDIKNSLMDYVNNQLQAGQSVKWGRMFYPATVPSIPDDARLFDIEALQISLTSVAVPAEDDLPIGYDEEARLPFTNFFVTVI